MGHHKNIDPDNDDRICRFCHEAGGDLIKPCKCSGDIMWVHRDCLNTWRSVSPNPSSFSRCDICNESYYMRKKPLGAGPYFKMVFGMIRDIFLVVLVVAVLIVIPGGVIAGIQHGTNFMHDYITHDSSILNIVANPVFDVFVLGAAFDCFIIGLCAIFYGIGKCLGKTCRTCCCFPVGEEANTYYRYDTYRYHSRIPSWWWWYVFLSPPRSIDPCCCCCCRACCCDPYHHHNCYCDCGRCDCTDCSGCGSCNCKCKNSGGGGGGGGGGLLIVLLVIVIIICIIGLVVGVFLLTLLTIRIIRSHVTILQKQKDAQELEVIDLSHGLAKDDPSIIVLDTNYSFVNPFQAQGSYVAPPKDQQPYMDPNMAGYPQAPVMTVGEGPTVPLMAAGEGPTIPLMSAGEDPTVPLMSAGEGPTAPPPDAYSQQPTTSSYDPSAPPPSF